MKTQNEATRSTHTPGPWTIESDWTTVTMAGQCVIVAPAPDTAPIAEHRANARLIAAAPDMLEALRVTAGNIRSLGPVGDQGRVWNAYSVWLQVVEAAIAKADGTVTS